MQQSLQIIFADSLDVLSSKEKSRYEAAILEWITRSIYLKDYPTSQKMNQWTIILHDTYEDIPLDRWTSLTSKEQVVSRGIPFGLTNDAVKEVHVWIVDTNNDMTFRQNCFAITHELGHMLLFLFYGSKRARRRHPDKRFAAGTEAAFAVTEVHDRYYEKRYVTVEIYRPVYSIFNLGVIRIRGIDIFDLTDTRLIDRPQ